MSEQYDEINVDEQPDEGVRNLRNALKERERRAKELEAELEAMRAEREAERQQARAAAVSEGFKSLGLSDKMASLYPGDREVSVDSIADWASSYGIAPTPVEPPRVESVVDSYNRLISQSTSQPTTSADDLTARITRGVKQAMDRKTMPTQAELEDAAALVEEVNLANRRLEQEIQAGRAQGFGADGVAAYGGRLQPPAWADRAAQARAQQ